MSTTDDVLDLLDHAWQRLDHRMVGLTDTEWNWRPTTDPRVSIRWRVHHLTQMLEDPRNWAWLSLPPPSEPATNSSSSSAEAALAHLASSYGRLRRSLDDETLDPTAPIGPAAGVFGEASRHSYVLHVADELIHHAAEAALLRDLYSRLVVDGQSHP